MTPAGQLPRLKTVAEAAGYLRVCTKTVRRLIEAGDLPAHRIGRQFRIAESDLRGLLNHTKP